MLSEKAAKKWRMVMYAEAVPCILNCYIPVLGKTTVWFLTLFAATEALYVLLQPRKWKRWIYSDHACWGCALFFFVFYFYIYESLSGNKLYTLLFLRSIGAEIVVCLLDASHDCPLDKRYGGL